MNIKRLILLSVIIPAVFLVQACSNTKQQLKPGDMRIWLSPANRSEVAVDEEGYIYTQVTEG